MKKIIIVWIGLIGLCAVSANAGQIAHWKFDEAASGAYTGTYADSSGNGHILTNVYTQNPHGAPGIDGNALYLLRDSSVSGMKSKLQNTNSALTALSSFSISMFVDPYVNNTKLRIFGGNNWGLEILDQDTESEAFNFWGKQASETKAVRGGTIPYERWDESGTVGDVTNNVVAWHHLGASYDASTGVMKLYVDGVRTTVSFSSAGDMLSGSGVYIDAFLGLIDDLQVYDEVLTDGQMEFLRTNPGSSVGEEPAPVIPAAKLISYWKFDEAASGAYTGTYADSSGNGHILTNVHTQNPQGATGIDGNALYLLRDSSVSGMKSKLQNTNSALTALSSFTISMFVDPYVNNAKERIFGGDHWGVEILDQDTESEAFNFWGKQASETKAVRGGTIPYEQWDASGTVGDVVDNTMDWIHLAASYDASTGAMALYVDGVKTTVSFSSAGDMLSGSGVYIDGFLGLIDELQIYDGVLPDDQIEFLRVNPGHALQAFEPAILTGGVSNGIFSVSSGNLILSGTNYLQMTPNLISGVWSNISYAVGVPSTNWQVDSTLDQSFFRVKWLP